MSWSTPPVFVVGQVLTAAQQNTLSDDLSYLFALPLRYRKATTKTVNTTTATTDLLNGEITIAAGALGTTGILRFSAWGDWLHNAGGNLAVPRLQLVLGGSTLIDTGGGSATAAVSGATRYTWRVEAAIANTNSASVQSVSFSYVLTLNPSSGVGGVLTTGEGGWNEGVVGTPVIGQAEAFNTGAVNTALAAVLALNVLNASASASYETKLYGALVEIL